MRALCIVDLHVAFNSIETLIVAMETQQWLPFVLLYSYKTFHTAVNNIIFFKPPYILAHIAARNLTHCGPVTQICIFTLQLCKTDDANLRFNTRLVSTHYTLNYAIHGAFLRMVLLMDVHRN